MNHNSIFTKWYFWILIILLIGAIGLGIYIYLQPEETFETSSKSIIDNIFNTKIENEKLTAENFEKLTTQYAEEHKDKDETYYLSYAMLNAAFTDGLSQVVSDAFENKTTDNSATYKSLFSKTIKELIEDGKKLMKENNITLEEYKKNLEQLNNLGQEQ